MAEKAHRMSRRALLAAAGMTPVMLAAVGLSPEVRAQVAVATTGTVPPSSGEKFGKVCERLWAAFLKGTDATPVAPDVIYKAVVLAGPHLAKNLGSIPDDGEDIETMFCAWRCGVLAAQAAGKAGSGPVTAQNFEAAYEATSTEMKAIWAKIGRNLGRGC